MTKQFLELGIDFDEFLAFHAAIHECADMNRLDLKAAAWKLAQDLRTYRTVGGIEKEQARVKQGLVFRSLLMGIVSSNLLCMCTVISGTYGCTVSD